MSSGTLGETPETPVFMKLVRDEDGGLKWSNIIAMLALTAISGYLATASQRHGGKIDFEKGLAMRAYSLGEGLGNRLTHLGISLSMHCARAYDKVAA